VDVYKSGMVTGRTYTHVLDFLSFTDSRRTMQPRNTENMIVTLFNIQQHNIDLQSNDF